MQRTLAACFIIVTILFAPCGPAAAMADSAATAATLAPYLDEQTICVARIDVTRIDAVAVVDEVTQQFAKLEAAGGGEFAKTAAFREGTERARMIAKNWVDEFEKAGGSDIFLVVSLADLPNTPVFAIVPVAEGGNHRAIAGLIYSHRPDGPTGAQPGRERADLEIVERLGDVVFAGSRKALARLKAKKSAPAERPELAAAFAATGDATIQVALIPSEDDRRVISEMLPPLPEELGSATGRQIADGLRWAAIGIDLPPKPKATLTIQSNGAESAQAIRRLIQGGCRLLARNKEVKELFPDFEKWVAPAIPEVDGDRLRVTLERKQIEAALAQLSVPLASAREAAKQTQCMNHLKQLAVAMYMLQEKEGHLPAAAIRDKDGKPLLSWRVSVLPYIGEEELYKQFRLDEPWDSPHNQKLIAKMPRLYACPIAEAIAKKGMTTYVVPVGEKTLFGKEQGVTLKDVRNPVRTIMLVEVDPSHAVIWTKPDDLQIDPDDPLKGIRGLHLGCLVAFCDGHIEALDRERLEPKKLQAMFTVDGGEKDD